MRRTFLITIIITTVTSLLNPNPVFCQSGFKDYSYLLPSIGYVELMTVDEQNNIWLCCSSGDSFDVFKLNSSRDEISEINLYEYMRDFKGIGYENIRIFFNGTALNDKVVFLARTDGGASYMVSYDGTEFSEPVNISGDVIDIFSDSHGNIWFSRDKDIVKFDGVTWQNINIPDDLLNYNYGGMCIDKNGNPVLGKCLVKSLGIFSGEIAIYNVSTGQWEFISKDIYIDDVFVDSENNIWCFSEGIWKYDGADWTEYKYRYFDEDFFPTAVFYCMEEDNEGKIWFGYEKGAVRLDENGWYDLNEVPDLNPTKVESMLLDHDGNFWFGMYGKLIAYIPETSVKTAELPLSESKLTNYPNPFNPSTTITFSVAEKTDVNISVYNISGQKIRTLINEKMNAGTHCVSWEGKNSSGKDVSAGIYFVKLKSMSRSITKKILKMN